MTADEQQTPDPSQDPVEDPTAIPGDEQPTFDMDEDLFDFPDIPEEIAAEIDAGRLPLDDSVETAGFLGSVGEEIDPLLDILSDVADVTDDPELDTLVGDVDPAATLSGDGLEADDSPYALDALGGLDAFDPLGGALDDLLDDTDLDEDIKALLEGIPPEVAAGVIRQPTKPEPVEDPLAGLDLDDLIPDAPEPDVIAPAAFVADVPAEEESEATEEEPVAARGPAFRRRTSVSSNIILFVAAGSLLLNVGLVLIAWRASSNFSEGVTGLREQYVATVNAQRRENLDLDRPQEAPQDPTPEVVRRPATTDSAPVQETLPSPTALESQEEIALQLAEEEIQRGDYVAARRRLFRLLALVDGLTGDERAQHEAIAAYRIADTYRLQAEELRELER